MLTEKILFQNRGLASFLTPPRLAKCDNLSGFFGTLPLDVIGYLLAVPWGLLQRLDDKRSSRGNNRAGGLPDIGFENNHFPELSIY